MRASRELHLKLSPEQQSLLDEWLLEFERDWKPDTLPNWHKRLPSQPPELAEAAMLELVKVDLERNWQAGKREPLAAYLDKYPSLGDRATVPAELIQAELEVRRQFGATAGRDFLAEQYPGRDEEWLPLLDASPTARRAAETSQAVDETLIKEVVHSTPATTVKADAEQPKSFGRYRLFKTLGRGGMGSVYLAEDTVLNRRCAIKLPHFDKKRDREILDRFHREAQAAAKLRHPNICAIYDVGDIEGVHFISMELVEGRPLSDFISPSKPGRQRATVQLILKLAAALKHAHQQQIVHRDLKPANIMIRDKTQPVVMDFGLACSLETSDKSRATAEGTMLGSPAFMSPEQVLGKIKEVGPTSDIYSLGVILYEMLTGRTPFQGSVHAILGQIIGQEPPRPSEFRHDVDPDLETICLKMMAKRSADRFQSMAEVEQTLTDWLRRVHVGADGTDTLIAVAPVSTPTPPTQRVDADSQPTLVRPATPIPSFPPLKPRVREEFDPKAQTILTAPPIKRDRKRRKSNANGWWLVGGLLGGIGVIWGIIILLTTGNGTLRIEVNDEDLEVAINGDEVRITDLRGEMDLEDGDHDLKILVGDTEVPIGEEFTLTTREHDGRYRLVVQLGDTEISDDSFTFNRDGETALRVTLEAVEDLANSEQALASVVSISAAMDNRGPLGVVTRDGIATVFPGSFRDVSVTSADGWSGAGTVGTRAPFPFCWIDVPDHNLPIVDPVPTERESVTQPAFLIHRDGLDSSVDVVTGTFEGDGTFDFEGADDYKPNSSGVIAVGPVFDSEAHCLGYAIRHDFGEPIRVYPLRREDRETTLPASDDMTPIPDGPPGEVVVFTGHTSRVTCVDVSSDGRYAVSGCYGGTVRLWELATGEQLHVFDHNEFSSSERIRIIYVGFSPDGRYVCSSNLEESELYVWDTVDRDLHLRLPHPERRVQFSFNSTGDRIFSICHFGNVLFEWDSITGSELNRTTIPDGDRNNRFSSDGRYLLSRFGVGVAAVIEVWDCQTGAKVQEFTAPPGADSDTWWKLATLVSSPDNRLVLTGGEDSRLRVWDMATGEERQNWLAHAPYQVISIDISEDQRIAVSSSAAQYDAQGNFQVAREFTIRLWDVAQKTEITSFTGHQDQIIDVVFTPDERFVVSASSDQTARVWRLPTRDMSSSVPAVADDAQVSRDEPVQLAVFPEAGWCMDAAVTPDGQSAVSVDLDGNVTLWDLASGAGTPLGQHQARVDQIAISQDSRYIATGGSADNGSFLVWDADAGAAVGPETFLNDGWLDVAFSSDDNGLFVAGNQKIWMYRKSPGAPGWTAENFMTAASDTAGKNHVVADPNNANRAYFTAADSTGDIVLWDFETRSEVRRFHATDPSQELAVSADGSRLLSRHGGTNILWWDTATAEVLLEIKQPGEAYLALSPDGTKSLIVTSASTVEYRDLVANEVICVLGVASHRAIIMPTGDRALISGPGSLSLWGLPMPLAVAPFDADQAAAHQRLWAEYLGVPVTYTNSIGMEFVLIPPGTFLMGSPDSEAGRDVDEGPQHSVTISQPFYMGVYEVSQGEYESVIGSNPASFSSTGGSSQYVQGIDTSRFPVESVGWQTAFDYCDRLTQLADEQAAGCIYHLPTEAQFEYACRAGTTTPYSDGRSTPRIFITRPFLNTPRAQGQGTPNAWGLCEMHGNVWEWCADWYGPYSADAAVDPLGAAQGPQDEKVMRGGWHEDGENEVGSAERCATGTIWALDDNGFRVMLEITPEFIEHIAAGAPVDAPPLAVAPFDAEQAAAHQRAWAEHLGVPVTFENELGMDFVLIPPGEFTMGAVDQTRDSDETPHSVTLTRPYYIGTHEVTVGQFARFVEDHSYQTAAERGEVEVQARYTPSQQLEVGTGFRWDICGFPQDDQHPVTCVTWGDSAEFCRWLSQDDEAVYRLPSEAEWECAARAGSFAVFLDGVDLSNIHEYANIPDPQLQLEASSVIEDLVAESSDGFAFTAPVRSYPPNAFGLHDVLGNVAEFCNDWYDGSYFTPSPSVDPTGPGPGSDRLYVARGDAWTSVTRLSNRYHILPVRAYTHLGFRVVLEITPEFITARQAEVSQSSVPATVIPADETNDVDLPRNSELDALRSRAEALTDESSEAQQQAVWEALVRFHIEHLGTPLAPAAAEIMSGLNSPYDEINRDDIAPYDLWLAGSGDADNVPAEIVGIFGDSRLKHWNAIYAADFSPDGESIVTGGEDGVVIIWNTSTGQATQILPRQPSMVQCVAYSPEGTQLATCCGDLATSANPQNHVVRIWDPETGELVDTLTGGHTGAVTHAAYSPDGAQLVSVGCDNRIILWDLTTGENRELGEHEGIIHCVAWDPERSRIATCSADRTVKVWNADDGELLADLTDHAAAVRVVAFNSDGTLLASGGEDNRIVVWQLSGAGQASRVAMFAEHTETVRALVFHPTSPVLASGCEAGLFKLWDLTTYSPIVPPAMGRLTDTWHTDIYALAVDDQGEKLASVGLDFGVSIRDAQSLQPMHAVSGHRAGIEHFDLDRMGRRAISAGRDGTACLWDPATGEYIGLLEAYHRRQRGVAVSPDGTRYVTTSHTIVDTVRIWNADGTLQESVDGLWPDSVRFSSDGQSILVGAILDGNSSRPTFQLASYDAETGAGMCAVPTSDRVYAASLSPDGAQIAWALDDGAHLQVNSALDGSSLHAGLEGHSGAIVRMEHNSSGSHLLTLSYFPCELLVWNMQSPPPTVEANLIPAQIGARIITPTGLAISPDDRLAAVTDDSGSIRVWDIATRQIVHEIAMSDGGRHFRDIAFAPDSRHLVVPDFNGALYIVRLENDPSADAPGPGS